MTPCAHPRYALDYLGMQTGLPGDEPLFLWNCSICRSTIAGPAPAFATTAASQATKGSGEPAGAWGPGGRGGERLRERLREVLMRRNRNGLHDEAHLARVDRFSHLGMI